MIKFRLDKGFLMRHIPRRMIREGILPIEPKLRPLNALAVVSHPTPYAYPECDWSDLLSAFARAGVTPDYHYTSYTNAWQRCFAFRDRRRAVALCFIICLGDRMEDRFEELAALRDGWLDGEGKAITTEALAQAKRIAATKNSVRVYPTEIGGVLLENEDGSWEVQPDGAVEAF